MGTEGIVALIAATCGGIGTVIFTWIKDWSKGRMEQAQKIQQKLDSEVSRRQAAEQALHAHRVALIQAGVPDRDLPSMPGSGDQNR